MPQPHLLSVFPTIIRGVCFPSQPMQAILLQWATLKRRCFSTKKSWPSTQTAQTQGNYFAYQTQAAHVTLPTHQRMLLLHAWVLDYATPPSLVDAASANDDGGRDTQSSSESGGKLSQSSATSFLALFNVGSGAAIPSVLGGLRSKVSVKLSAIRPTWSVGTACTVRDLWQHRNLGVVDHDSITISLAAHDAALLSVTCNQQLNLHSEFGNQQLNLHPEFWEGPGCAFACYCFNQTQIKSSK